MSQIRIASSDQIAVKGRSSRHKEILEAILGGIANGRFRAGDRLPTEVELSKTYSASRTTVAKVLRELKDRGLLNRRRGGGTRVAGKGNDGVRLALFAPFATLAVHSNAPNLGFIGGQIYTQLSGLASQRAHDLSLRICGVFYYPVKRPQEIFHYNQIVVDKIRVSR